MSKINFLVLLCFLINFVAGVEINCQRPPQLVDPALCCKDGGRDEITESCAKRMGITGQPSDPQPSVETATCLAECILTESKYMPQPEQISLETIKSDLSTKFPNESGYVQAMHAAYEKCIPNTQKKMQSFRQMMLSQSLPKRGCSPYSGMLLGCTYMEYFKNCPVNRWTESADCSLAKQFVQQCGLGAN